MTSCFRKYIKNDVEKVMCYDKKALTCRVSHTSQLQETLALHGRDVGSRGVPGGCTDLMTKIEMHFLSIISYHIIKDFWAMDLYP